jgi:hypothetical protein
LKRHGSETFCAASVLKGHGFSRAQNMDDEWALAPARHSYVAHAMGSRQRQKLLKNQPPGPQLFLSILEVQPRFQQGEIREISACFSYF